MKAIEGKAKENHAGDNITLLLPLTEKSSRKIPGRVTVTNYRLRFEATAEMTRNSVVERGSFSKEILCLQKRIIDVPLCCIERVEKYGGKMRAEARGEESYGALGFIKSFTIIKRMFCSLKIIQNEI